MNVFRDLHINDYVARKKQMKSIDNKLVNDINSNVNMWHVYSL